jgi:hypothetical protein
VRWFSSSGEFAFFSVGGVARGIIAVGGVAHGVIALGAIASVGVISIGMNAVGSVAAFGMNALAPISLSLINGLGIYSVAGVNGWGAWSYASVNSTGLFGHGGVNSDHSVVPAVLTVAILILLSSLVRGRRERRVRLHVMPLRSFVRSLVLAETPVSARLAAVRLDAIELADGRERLVIPGNELLTGRALAIAEASKSGAPPVVATLVRSEETVAVAQEVGYRERPPETTRTVVRCVAIEAPPRSEGWLPADALEVQWVLAWSARIAAVVSIALLAWWARG